MKSPFSGTWTQACRGPGWACIGRGRVVLRVLSLTPRWPRRWIFTKGRRCTWPSVHGRRAEARYTSPECLGYRSELPSTGCRGCPCAGAPVGCPELEHRRQQQGWWQRRSTPETGGMHSCEALDESGVLLPNSIYVVCTIPTVNARTSVLVSRRRKPSVLKLGQGKTKMNIHIFSIGERKAVHVKWPN